MQARTSGKAITRRRDIIRFISIPLPIRSLVQTGCLRALQFVTGGLRATERRHEHTHPDGADLRFRRHGPRRREDLRRRWIHYDREEQPSRKARRTAGEDERGRTSAEG